MSSQTMISLKPQNVIRQIPWRLDSRAALGFVLILITFSLVGWLYLTQASVVTTTSYRIDELRLELDHLKNQNAGLILEIAELEALSRVEVRARELGFKPTTEIDYVSVPNYPIVEEEGESAFHSTRADVAVEAYVADIEEPSWWVERLDALAAWLEDGASIN
jgi:hypothetical protein